MKFLKELMLIRQANQKNAMFFTIGIFLDKAFKFQPNLYNGCHDLFVMSMNLSDIAILNMKVSNYCCIISGISKSEAINIMKNIDLIEESGTLKNIKIYYHIEQ